VDVFVLAFLFTIEWSRAALQRLSGDDVAAGLYQLPVLGLAFLKRCSELVRIQAMGRPAPGLAGYGVVDLSVLQMFGVASTFIAIMVLGLYLNSAVAETHYRFPGALWAVGPALPVMVVSPLAGDGPRRDGR